MKIGNTHLILCNLKKNSAKDLVKVVDNKIKNLGIDLDQIVIYVWSKPSDFGLEDGDPEYLPRVRSLLSNKGWDKTYTLNLFILTNIIPDTQIPEYFVQVYKENINPNKKEKI